MRDENSALLAAQVAAFLDEIPGGFLIYRASPGEEILYANSAIPRLFGCESLAEFLDWTNGSFRGIVHPDDLESVEISIQEQLANSQHDLDYVEYRIIQKDGTIRWIEDYGHFVHSKSVGDIFYVFLGDATEKRQQIQEEREAILSEKILKEQLFQNRIDTYSHQLELSNQQLLLHLEIIEGLSIDYESIFYVDLEKDRVFPYRKSNRIENVFSNETEFKKFFEFASDYIRTWVYPEDQALVTQALNADYICQQLAERKAFHVNYRSFNKNQGEYLQIRIVNVSQTAQVSQVVIGCRSVDDEIRQEMEQKEILETALTQLKAANLIKDTFLSNMSHDMRTPMNAVVGFAALAKKHINEKARILDCLNRIGEASAQLLHLMDDVLEISCIGSGSVHIDEEPYSLIKIAEELKDIIQAHIQEKDLTFYLDIHNIKHPDVYCDHQKLFQILWRLADNAIKYTRHGEIRIIISEQPAADGYGAYCFQVSDTGIGIDKTFIEHLFEPFERQQNTTMSGVQGTGLGLPIVKSLLDLMDGTIEVSSKPGQGSIFTVFLALRLQEPASEHSCNSDLSATSAILTSSTLSDSHPEQPRILLVEDNELNRAIGEDLLQDTGFLVDSAENGKIAVEKIQSAPAGYYDLILMDIQMPVMDGHSAAREIRHLNDPVKAALPIVALSANAMEEDRKLSIASGMNAHMAKPIQMDYFLELFEALTGKHIDDPFS